jgi:predicted MFS family arabinose efflux permease
MFPDTYKRVLGAPGVKQPLAGVIIGRLSIAAEPLSAILLVHATTGSFAIAGAVMGAYSIAAAISLPVQGRIIDRIGQTRVILTATVIGTSGFAALILLAHGGASAGWLVAAGTVAGLGTLPTGATMRTLWSELVPDPELRQAAFAIDAVAIDVAFIVGPLIAAAVIAVASPTASLCVCIGLTVVGSAVFASSPASRRWRGADTDHRRIGPLRSASVWVLMGAAFGIGLAVGAAELAITAFASDHGAAELGGTLIAVQAVASTAGGLWYGARKWRNHPGDRLAGVMLIFALCLLPLAAIPSLPAAFPLMALSGLALAPAISLIYLLLDSLAPVGTAAEATGWVLMAIVGGAALGNAAAGVAVSEVSPHAGLAVAVAGGLVSLVATWLGRANLRMPAVREQPFARVHSM